MTTKQCKDYGLKCLQCPYWNHWTNFCTKWKITTSTSGDGMTKKRFEVIMNEFDEVEYIMDKEMMEDRDFADFMDFVEEVCKENEQLKSEINGLEELLKSYRKTIKHDAELLADASKKGYLPPLKNWREL